MLLPKICMKELISAASSQALLPKDLSWMGSENWFVVSEKLTDNFF